MAIWLEDDSAERIDAASRERDKRLADLESTPDNKDCHEAAKKIRNEFERKRGKIALEFVKSMSPLAWWSAQWLQDAITHWYFVGIKGSAARENLRKVTQAMGHPRFAHRAGDWRKRLHARHRLQRLAAAQAEVNRLTPVCRRLKRITECYREQELDGVLAQWIYSGEKDQEDLIAATLGFDQTALEADFDSLRACFGGQLVQVDGKGFRFRLPDFDHRAPVSDEKVRLCNFLNKVTKEQRPGRLAAMLASRRHDIPVHDLEASSTKEPSDTPPDQRPRWLVYRPCAHRSLTEL